MHDTELALVIDRFMRRIHFRLQEKASDFDRESVGPGGGIIIMTLAEMGCTGLNELTKRVARDKSQMTRSIRSLEKKGLVKRTPSSEDGRVSLVELTPEGTAVARELTEAVAQAVGELLDPLSSEEKQALKRTLAKACRV